jgi:hypothetical protein
MNNQTKTVIRWAARITGGLVLGFLLFFVFGHLFGNEPSNGFQSNKEILAFACFPVTTILGLLLAFRYELPGGLLTLAAMAGLYFLMPELLANPYTGAVFVPALLFVWSGVLGKG